MCDEQIGGSRRDLSRRARSVLRSFRRAIPAWKAGSGFVRAVVAAVELHAEPNALPAAFPAMSIGIAQ